MAANVKPKPSQSNSDNDAAEDRASLVAIEEQGRQTLELLRALVALLTPKEGVREGPSLEELLTTIIMQGREQIGILKTIQEVQLQVADALPQAVADAVVEQLGTPRHARS
jgi:signal transduction histidine kinase